MHECHTPQKRNEHEGENFASDRTWRHPPRRQQGHRACQHDLGIAARRSHATQAAQPAATQHERQHALTEH